MSRRGPIILLACALAASGALLLSLDSRLTFVADGWALLVRRQGWSLAALLDPFHEQMVLAPALIYKVLLAVFGMGSALPFFVVSICLFLLGAILLFAYVRARLGDWPALIAALLVLFLGAASEDLLWEFQMGFFGAVAAGLGVLLALNREDRRGDIVACGLLVVSLGFSSVGAAFVAAAAADLAFGRSPRLPRAYVCGIPVVAYACWALATGTAGNSLTFENLVHLPGYVFDAAGAGIASLLGRQPTGGDGHAPILCQVAVVVLVGLGALRVFRDGHRSRQLAVVLVLTLAFWALTGLGRNLGRYATSSRYQYPSAVFILLVATELLRGLRIPRMALAVMSLVTAGAIVGGIGLLNRDYRHLWHPMSNDVRLTLAAYDIAGDSLPAGARIPVPAPTTISARGYLRARDRWGTPALSEDAVLGEERLTREGFDEELAEIVGLRLAAPVRGPRRRGCRTIGGGSGSAAGLAPGGYALRYPGPGSASIRAGRFSPGHPVELGTLPPAATRFLSLPQDASPRPWRLFSPGAGVRLCHLGS